MIQLNMIAIKCPSCRHRAKLELVPSRSVTECTVPEMLKIYGPGGDQQSHTYYTDRTITWRCTNKKCEQSKDRSQVD